MSENAILQSVPLGSILAWSDGTPRPPRHQHRKQAAWRARNGKGRLVRKDPGDRRRGRGTPSYCLLHAADDRQGELVTIRTDQTTLSGIAVRVTVLERPAVGSIRVLSSSGPDAQVLCVVADVAAAQKFLSCYRFRDAVLEAVSADEILADATLVDQIAADFVEGRSR